MTTTAQTSPGAASEDRHLKRELGFWHLTGISLGGVIGSGWLLAPMTAARNAGPASVLAWGIGGLALVLMAMVLVELGASVPLSGGLVRWPFHSSGRLVGTLASWSIWVAYAINPPSESAAMLQYLDRYVPGLHRADEHLTLLGTLFGFAIMAVFVAVNWFGVRRLAQVNLVLTIGKVAVPVITAAALFASGFHSRGFTGHHGFAPLGYGVVLTSITTSGVFFAYTGFQGPLDVSGEARNAKRDIPRAVVTAVALSMLVYMVLQVAFIGTVPGGQLIHGWNGIDPHSTLVQLALSLNLTWLSVLLSGGAVASPGGSALVYTTESSRAVFAMGGNGLVPTAMAKVHRASGTPRRALAVNALVGAVILVSLKSWTNMVALSGVLTLFGYSLSLISEQAIRRRRPLAMANWVGGTWFIAPTSFVVTTLLFYWSTWAHIKPAAVVLLAALIGYGWKWRTLPAGRNRELVTGRWMLVYLAALFAISKLGNYGGVGAIPKPWDSVLAGAVGLAGYLSGLRAAVAHLSENEGELEGLLRTGTAEPGPEAEETD